MADQKAWMKSSGTVKNIGFPSLSYAKAIEFVNSGNSCLVEVEKHRQVSLAPRYLGQLNVGIREFLDAEILKYSDELEGIIVCYKQVQCLEMSGCINDETPLVHFVVNVKYIVFRPEVGAKLKGIVNRVGHGHYGCLVHGCFNGSVHKIKVDPTEHNKKIIKKISKIDVGTEFVFRITRFDVHYDVLSIKGKIDQEDLPFIKNSSNKDIGEKEKNFSLCETKDLSHSGEELNNRDTSVNGDVSIYSSTNESILSPKDSVADESMSKKKKDKHKKRKRKHSDVTQDVKTENNTNFKIDNDDVVMSKKKKK